MLHFEPIAAEQTPRDYRFSAHTAPVCRTARDPHWRGRGRSLRIITSIDRCRHSRAARPIPAPRPVVLADDACATSWKWGFIEQGGLRMHLPPVAENDLCGGLQFGRAEGVALFYLCLSRRRLDPRVRRSPEPRVEDQGIPQIAQSAQARRMALCTPEDPPRLRAVAAARSRRRPRRVPSRRIVQNLVLRLPTVS
jgi:hypothetical protein